MNKEGNVNGIYGTYIEIDEIKAQEGDSVIWFLRADEHLQDNSNLAVTVENC